MSLPPRWRALAAESCLLTTAAIWGFAFVAQRRGLDYMGPFLFNALRFALGCVPLVPFVLRSRRAAPSRSGPALRRGVWLGLLVFGGASLQQVGLLYTTVGKAGFITGLYVVLVPVLGALLGVGVGLRAWVGAVIAAVGLYFLTFLGVAPDGRTADARTIANLGDLLMLGCALFWATHIVAVGRWAGRLPWPQLALSQFVTCALLSLGAALVSEEISLTAIRGAWLPLLYAGLLSVGLGYTLQVVAQRDAPATPAAVIMSLETVFAAVGGWWLLDEHLGGVALVGCVLMLAGMVLASSGARPPRSAPG